MATKQERDMILDMLASGKINVSEARDLFDSIDRCEELNMDDDPLSLGESVCEWVRSTGKEILHAVKSAEQPFLSIH